MAAGIDREELRALVRQALKESLGSAGNKPASAGDGLAGDIRAGLAGGKPATVALAPGTGDDLDRFARAIAEACADETLRTAIAVGDVRFDAGRPSRPAAPAPAAQAKAAPAAGSVFEMSSGILGEAKIVEISRSHRKIVIGSDVVMTPLARDKAREMKVELVRQKP